MMQYLLYVGYAVPLRCADVLVICSLFSVVVFLFHYVCDGTMVNPNRKGTKKPKNTIDNSLPSPDGDAIMQDHSNDSNTSVSFVNTVLVVEVLVSS